jgi:hypothetical protein
VLITKLKPMACIPLAVSLLTGEVSWLTALAQPTPAEVKLNRETFAQLRKQIRPQPGESRWMEIPWLIDVHEARKKAAAEGKPLFVYSGGGATGIGAC